MLLEISRQDEMLRVSGGLGRVTAAMPTRGEVGRAERERLDDGVLAVLVLGRLAPPVHAHGHIVVRPERRVVVRARAARARRARVVVAVVVRVGRKAAALEHRPLAHARRRAPRRPRCDDPRRTSPDHTSPRLAPQRPERDDGVRHTSYMPAHLLENLLVTPGKPIASICAAAAPAVAAGAPSPAPAPAPNIQTFQLSNLPVFKH